MPPAMFGMGMNEILVILVVAMLFLGPEKLPDAAKTISKGIRDLRKQTREFQDTIENDTEIGGAIRDIKSALRGEDMRRPPVKKPPAKPAADAAAEAAAGVAAAEAAAIPAITSSPGIGPDALAAASEATAAAAPAAPAPAPAASEPVAEPAPAAELEPAAEPDPAAEAAAAEAAELASLIKPAVGAIGRGQS